MKKIIDLILSKHRFLITSHVRLDGDAIGSELALYHFLRDMGKEVGIYNQDETPHNYLFLPGSEVVMHTLNTVEDDDAIFVLDCSEIERIGEAAPRVMAAKCIINIDHHISNGGNLGASLIDATSSSTGEILFRLIKAMGSHLTKEIAVNLYTAILTDTGSFRYSNTGKETFAVAGKLVEAGAEPHVIAEQVYDCNPNEKYRLLARVLDTLEFFWSGRIGTLWVSQRMIRDAGALPEYTENFVDHARSVRGVDVAAFFSEISENYYRVSLRSKGSINVERVARKFGGGGHVNAAACKIEGPLEDVKSRTVQSIMNG